MIKLHTKQVILSYLATLLELYIPVIIQVCKKPLVIPVYF